MEFILKNIDGSEKLLLPVPPQEFTIAQGNNNQVVTVEKAGELIFIGKPKLASITLSSFFPNQKYPFCIYNDFPKPYDCVSLIEDWRINGIALILDVSNSRLSLTCCIEEFSYGEKDGSGDVYFTLMLKEYRLLGSNDSARYGYSVGYKRSVNKEPNTTCVVRQGDTLWTIAKRELGDGSKWKSIAQKNGIRDIGELQNGQRLVL